MIYVCLYNTDSKEIIGAEEYTDPDKAYERFSMYEVESRARGGDKWKPYMGDKPFEFEPEVVE